MNLRWAVIPAVAVIIAAGAALWFRDDAARWWIGRKLATGLESSLGADVQLDEVSLNDGLLRIGRCRISGGDLPFASLEATDTRSPAGWRRILEPAKETIHIEAASALVVLQPEAPEQVAAVKTESNAIPSMDILVADFTLRGADGQAINGAALRAVHGLGTWSFAGNGGELNLPGFAPLRIDRFSAEHSGGTWRIGGFAVNDGAKGALAGSAAETSSGWSAEFSWQDLAMGKFLPSWTTNHVQGLGSGDGKLDNGVLRGRMQLTGLETKSVPALLKMASLFTGENWDNITWEMIRFDFTREAGGRISVSNLVGVSPAGLAVRGSGTLSGDNLAASLEFGVQREGRPWLVAFMPSLFRAEKAGYFWTPVNIGGTADAPTEDLSPRVAAALATAPVDAAVEAAAGISDTAVDAAGSLLDKLLGR